MRTAFWCLVFGGVVACGGGSGGSNDPGSGSDIPSAQDVLADPGTAEDPGVTPDHSGGKDAEGGTDTSGGTDPGPQTDPGTIQDPGGTSDTGPGGVTYEPPNPATTFTYLLKPCDDTPPEEVPARIAGDVEIGGQTWRRLEVGDFQAPTRNGFVSYTRIHQGRYEVIGADVYQAGDPNVFLSWRFDQPIGGPISGQDGLSETTSATGTLCVMGNCDPYDISVTYTLVSSNETVQVAYGTVTGAIHIHFEQRSSDMGDFVLQSDWWVKSGIGLIKATEVPGFCGLELKSVKFPAL